MQPRIRILISDRNNKPSLYDFQRCLWNNCTASKPNWQHGSHLTGSVNSGSCDISNEGWWTHSRRDLSDRQVKIRVAIFSFDKEGQCKAVNFHIYKQNYLYCTTIKFRHNWINALNVTWKFLRYQIPLRRSCPAIAREHYRSLLQILIFQTFNLKWGPR
jgi:hypothetical protein